jgi:hypothetical protein
VRVTISGGTGQTNTDQIYTHVVTHAFVCIQMLRCVPKPAQLQLLQLPTPTHYTRTHENPQSIVSCVQVFAPAAAAANTFPLTHAHTHTHSHTLTHTHTLTQIYTHNSTLNCQMRPSICSCCYSCQHLPTNTRSHTYFHATFSCSKGHNYLLQLLQLLQLSPTKLL